MRAYIEALGCRFDFFVFKAIVDAGSRHESTLEHFSFLDAELFAFCRHEFDGGLGVPVLVHVCVFLVLNEKAVQSFHHVYEFKLSF